MYLCTLYVNKKEVELITNILIEYLKHNKRIIVPKLGAFLVKQPSGVIRFTDLMRNDDGVLRSLLIAYGMSELEANGKIDRFVFEIRHAINQDGKYLLTDFGEFRASENNTIIFSHKSEPKVIGGNVKPPIEVLNAEKLKLQHLASVVSAQQERTPKPQKSNSKIKPAEETPLSLSKPDHYLRGLNYDDRKKKRGEERTDKRRAPRRISPMLVLFIIAIVAGFVYGAWYWLNSKRVAQQQPIHTIIEDPIVIEPDSLILRDSLMMTSTLDSLQQVPMVEIEIKSDTTNNIVTE